jgi:hypothetical protein
MPASVVYVLSVQAVAGPANAEPDGRRYDILAFVRGEDERAAESAARQGLSELGWDEPVVLRAGEITDPGALPLDLEPSYRRALAQGCSLIVYDQP